MNTNIIFNKSLIFEVINNVCLSFSIISKINNIELDYKDSKLIIKIYANVNYDLLLSVNSLLKEISILLIKKLQSQLDYQNITINFYVE